MGGSRANGRGGAQRKGQGTPPFCPHPSAPTSPLAGQPDQGRAGVDTAFPGAQCFLLK